MTFILALSSRPCAGISWHGKTAPAKTYEANTAAKNKFFDIVEPMGVALAQQVRGDMLKESALDLFDFALRASLRVTLTARSSFLKAALPRPHTRRPYLAGTL